MRVCSCAGADANRESEDARDSRIPATKSSPNVKLAAIRHPIPRLRLKDDLWIQNLIDIIPLLDNHCVKITQRCSSLTTSAKTSPLPLSFVRWLASSFSTPTSFAASAFRYCAMALAWFGSPTRPLSFGFAQRLTASISATLRSDQISQIFSTPTSSLNTNQSASGFPLGAGIWIV